jgi:two-component system, OmpR family, sensor kinase
MSDRRGVVPRAGANSRMSQRPSSLRSRLTLWYTIILGVPLIVFAIVSYVTFTRTLQIRTDDFVGDALTAFSRELVAERRATTSTVIAMQTTVKEVRFRDLQIAILDASGGLVAHTTTREVDGGTDRPTDVTAQAVAALEGHEHGQPVALTMATAEGPFRVLSRPLSIEGQQFVLTGAYALSDIDAMLDRIRVMYLIAIPLLLLAAATGASVLAKRGLAPLSSMASHAATISASNLHERLPVTGGEELVVLAQVVNDLLNRLDHSFEQQRRFVADASHELRTPTAILRTEADVTLSRPHRTEEEYRASVAIMQDASQRLGRVVDDLFLLARADAGHLVMHPEALYLEELVHDATRAVGSVAQRHGVEVKVGELAEAPFDGDPHLLGRLLLNLLDNAIKYSPAGGAVVVGLRRDGGEYQVTVADTGEGIPPEVQSRIFERFYRVDAARSRSENSSTSGAGLGLAIALSIAEMHAGRLDLAESRPGRTVFRLVLPVGGQPVVSA